MSDVGNYSEVADATGQDEVTITVGAQGNGGAFAFGPPAVQIDPGTTVVWEWNGEGGQHNVVAE
ncbi:plastocyanin/azurin family copper-binding protein, partial [Haloplanus litoreus]